MSKQTEIAVLLILGPVLIVHGYVGLGLMLFIGGAVMEWKSNSQRSK
jgi:hypothetical protein